MQSAVCLCWKLLHSQDPSHACGHVRAGHVLRVVLAQQDLRTYVAPDLEQLKRRIEKRESIWCGWDRFLGASDTECVARISPFGQTLVAVADSKGAQRHQSGVLRLLTHLVVFLTDVLALHCHSPLQSRAVQSVSIEEAGVGMLAGFVCSATVEEKVSYVQLAQEVLGAALYWWAGPLSHSIFFRLSAGSLGFMLLSVLILIFVLSRCRIRPLAGKRTAAVALHQLHSAKMTKLGQLVPK